MTPTPLSECLEFAVQAARRAGEIIMPYYQGDVGVEIKGDGSPVTLADRGAEQELRRLIRERFPADAVLGEEFGEQPGTSGRRWILDPIDGTKAFVPLGAAVRRADRHGRERRGGAGGDVHAGAGRVRLRGAGGRAAGGCRRAASRDRRRGGRGVSSLAPLAEGLLLLNSYEYFVKGKRTAAHDRLLQAARQQRGWGDCYGHILVATGRAEACVDPMMNPWDNAPLLPILQEAGGTFTDWQGRATIHGGDGISTNGKVFDEVMRVVRD